MLEVQCEAASEARHDYVPSVNLAPRVLREAQHVLEGRDVEGQEEARVDNVFEQEP